MIRQDFLVMMLGTLVLNQKTGKVEAIESMAYPRPPEHLGKINDNPISEYKHLPVSPTLLSVLGWKMNEEKIPNVICATPPEVYFENITNAKRMEVRFVLEHKAFDDWPAGWILINNPNRQRDSIDYFIDLELHFIKMYSRRMPMQLNREVFDDRTEVYKFRKSRSAKEYRHELDNIFDNLSQKYPELLNQPK